MQHQLARLHQLAHQLRVQTLALRAAQRAGDEAKLAAVLEKTLWPTWPAA